MLRRKGVSVGKDPGNMEGCESLQGSVLKSHFTEKINT